LEGINLHRKSVEQEERTEYTSKFLRKKERTEDLKSREKNWNRTRRTY
jgi:hypothetical protein